VAGYSPEGTESRGGKAEALRAAFVEEPVRERLMARVEELG